MKIWVAPYSLRPTSESFTGGLTQGYLLRVECAEGQYGYSCLQSWPALGERAVQQELRWLSEGRASVRMRWLLYLAIQEGKARANPAKPSRDFNFLSGTPSLAWSTLWGRVERPLFNHQLCRTLADLAKTLQFSGDDARMEDPGFRTLKVKLGRDWPEFVALVARFSDELLGQYKWRLDFNGQLSAEEYQHFCTRLGELDLDVDYIEDPIPWDPAEWRRLRAKTSFSLARDVWADAKAEDSAVDDHRMLTPQTLAEDFSLVGARADEDWQDGEAFDVVVIKPLVLPQTRWPSITIGKRRWIFTSNLDHPVGQMLGLWQAAQFYQGQNLTPEICGFYSHPQYHANVYSDQMLWTGSRLVGTTGRGIGFDQLLEKEPWQAI